MAARGGLPDEQERREAAERWRVLPPVVPASEMVELQAVDEPQDPDGGRDPDRDWMIRHA